MIYQKYYIQKQINQLRQFDIFSHNIENILKYPKITNIINKDKNADFSHNEIITIIEFLHNNFPDIFFSLMLDKDRFARQVNILSNSRKIGSIPEEIILPNFSDIIDFADILFDKFNLIRDTSAKRPANYIDACALSYINKINELNYNKNNFTILISNAASMFKVLELYAKDMNFTYMKEDLNIDKIPAVIHPFALLLFYVNFDNDLETTSKKLNTFRKELERLIGKFRNRKYDLNDSMLNYHLIGYTNDEIVSRLILQELECLLGNKEFIDIISSFKKNINEKLQYIRNILGSHQDSWDEYRKQLYDKIIDSEKIINEALSNESRIKELKPFIYGMYLFEYENDRINDLLAASILKKVGDILKELSILKSSKIVEAFHLSAYINGKLGNFEIAEKDIEEGLKLANNDQKRMFYYLNNINLSNRGRLDKAIRDIAMLIHDYGNNYPRFYLHSGYLNWIKWLTKEENKLLDNAINDTEKTIVIASKNRDKFYKCLLLGYANLVRYNTDKKLIDEAEKNWNLLVQTYHDFEGDYELKWLPLFSFVKCFLWMAKIHKTGNVSEGKKLCTEIVDQINECKQNFLVVNKLAQNQYANIIKEYNSICKMS